MDSAFSWKAIDSWSNKARKNFYIKKLYYTKGTSFCGAHHNGYPISLSWFTKEHTGSIHLVDFDGDQDFDVIFEGYECSGHESTSVVIFENVEGKLIERLSAVGRVANLNLKRKELVVFKYGCCGAPLQQLIHFTYKSEDKLSVKKQNTNSYLQDPIMLRAGSVSIFPEQTNISKAFILDSTASLRWSPDTLFLDGTMNSGRGDTTNISANYPAGSKGKVLFESNNWVYVLMENNIEFTNYCSFYKNVLNKNSKSYGWFLKPED